MSRIAIIPARGGSKRIPRKNIKEFCGKPIIAYPIAEALNSGLFDEVMVSTDDIEIAEIAESFGAKVPFLRSESNSDDYASTEDVLNEVLLKYKEVGKKFDYCCCIYPATPLISSEKIRDAYNLLKNGNYDSVIPLARFGSQILRSLCIDNQKVKLNWAEYEYTRTQDLPISYFDPGQFYWFNVDSYMEKLSLLTDNTGSIELSELEVQDIDNEIDWQIAELKFKLLHNH